MTLPLRDWYRGQRVLLTGHTGFKGSWLTAWLRDAGAEVTGYALAPEDGSPSLFELAGLSDGIDSVIADIRDRGALDATVMRARPSIVFHLAAQSLVRRSYAEPVRTFDVNVTGTAQLLDAVRHQASVRAVVVVTSDKCYENREWARGYREDDALGGHDPYSNSKACTELVTAAFRNSFFHEGVALASARAGNVIGGGDWALDRLVPDLVRAAAAGVPAKIRNPRATRPWQHVLEPLGAYLLLAEKLVDEGARYAEAWNFGPAAEDIVAVEEVLERVTARWKAARWTQDPRSHPHEARLLALDCSKAAERLGWRPRRHLDEAVEWTVDWYQAWLEKRDLQRLSLEQIERFAALEPA